MTNVGGIDDDVATKFVELSHDCLDLIELLRLGHTRCLQFEQQLKGPDVLHVINGVNRHELACFARSATNVRNSPGATTALQLLIATCWLQIFWGKDCCAYRSAV
jgi:hypothetical protein